VYGYLNVYWDGSTGQNCATVTSSSVDWGLQKPMSVYLGECSGDFVVSCSTYIASGDDGSGNTPWGSGSGYRYNAGPVNVPAAGHCVQASALVYFDGQLSSAEVTGDC
jgi:hypothetical protein